MKELHLTRQARGTQILLGNERRRLVSAMAEMLTAWGCTEIILPTIEPIEVYEEKIGAGLEQQMWAFNDKSHRAMCLRPEGTATCQLLAQGPLKFQNDLKLWYEARCFRYEKPQAGRYREFTQIGVEVLSPTKDWRTELVELAVALVELVDGLTAPNFEVHHAVKRGLGYYTEDGFEITIPSLGAQKQVVGGGRYAEGIGFAIGLERLMLAGEGRS